jgi:type VI protein secretion system component VasK
LSAITITWAQVLLVALAAIGLYLLELWGFMRAARRQSAQERRTLERLDAIQAELTQVRERLEAAEAGLESVRRAPQSSGQYREAVEMAERGADASAVAERCGISRAEADLIVALYRSRAA